ncbi:ABC transporter ATP-binding protein [Phosphitispora fastidiosa]|uniref:ABC transporter ATP-binding protein n=1 Tax=Phosphitispora fastidiosa TaxID=2837202 RepID=UPI001E5BBBF4|nr:ABC transporter ATP-binding protein [Phosphitispora fastidiosa]MBU7008188.1 lipopolysaccharide transport system ATP-binding protein [Phosphitispora fastidiosa]
MSTIIEVENLGKKYILRHQKQERYSALRDVVAEGAKKWWNKILNPFAGLDNKSTIEEFWALRDVSFKIDQGDRVGIIGRNGAGKSTLLKILSRITDPTTGRILLKGRVASLLEVGTGFHPELTGRENIYLNGAILGMSKNEIKRKFDEIVAFAEVEKFLDTPVKRYSSGMYVRLAFAVAAHLEPEILVVDEVLAVGDAQFQKKCLGKMEEVGKEGRTVLFVSHNMAAVKNLCTSSILLTQGQVEYIGETQTAINNYLKMSPSIESPKEYLANNKELGVVFKNIEFLDDDGDVISCPQVGLPMSFRMSFKLAESYDNVLVSIGVETSNDLRTCVFHSKISGAQLKLVSPRTSIVCRLPKLNIFPGRYLLSIKVMSGDKMIFWLPYVVEMVIEDGDFFDTGRLPERDWGGLFLAEHNWTAIHKTKEDSL